MNRLSMHANHVLPGEALMHGWQATIPVRSFFDEVTAAAAIAPLLPGKLQLQIGLTGTS